MLASINEDCTKLTESSSFIVAIDDDWLKLIEIPPSILFVVTTCAPRKVCGKGGLSFSLSLALADSVSVSVLYGIKAEKEVFLLFLGGGIISN